MSVDIRDLIGLIGRLLNPRADLSKLRETQTSSQNTSDNDEHDLQDIPQRRVRLRHVVTNVPLLL
ncbi:MAG TPA: hypothetical protein ENN19_15330, partial [Chloroflexi bacterium]|nr:hypothetical protein [Chloroflexota bacterium]